MMLDDEQGVECFNMDIRMNKIVDKNVGKISLRATKSEFIMYFFILLDVI